MKQTLLILVSALSISILTSCIKDNPHVIACISVESDSVLIASTTTSEAGEETTTTQAQVQFESCSMFADRHEWYFGDADDTQSSEKDPLHTYTKTGRFAVTLKVYRGEDTKDSVSTYIVVHEPLTEEEE